MQPGAPSNRSTRLASLPASRVPARGHSTCQRRRPSVPTVVSSAGRTSMPASSRVRTTRSSSGRPVGPTSAVVTRSVTVPTAPTWSRSKCVSTSRSMRSTPSRSRHACRRSSSSPVSTRAVAVPPRTSTASPCPTSHAATVQSCGRPARTTRRGTATIAAPITTTTAASSNNRSRTGPGARIATVTAALTSTATATPNTPPGHGTEANGSDAAPWATHPMALAGTQATPARTVAPAGHHGAVKHAASPTTVTTGARGSTTRFAGTAYVGRAAESGIVTGQQASWADTGTDSAAATGAHSRRARSAVRGGPRTTMPLVARTESANPKDLAIQGSAMSMPIAARAMSGTPRTGRPVRCTTRTTVAITVARTIDGSGRTRTTNASRSTIATAARAQRGSPTARPRTTTSPTMTAQFAPDTAVRCVSAVVSIAVSVAGSRPLRSPIARPRRSPAPGSGSVAVTDTNAARARSVSASSPVGGSVSGSSRRNATKDVVPPGSSRSSDADATIRVPAARAPSAVAAAAGTTRTGTRSPPTVPARSSVAATDRSPGARSRVSTASIVTGPASAASSDGGLRRSSPTATETATTEQNSARAKTIPSTPDPRRPRPTRSPARPPPARTPPPTADHPAVAGAPTSTAAQIHAAATGPAIRTSRSAGRRSTPAAVVTPAPGRAGPRTARHRCR